MINKCVMCHPKKIGHANQTVKPAALTFTVMFSGTMNRDGDFNRKTKTEENKKKYSYGSKKRRRKQQKKSLIEKIT